MVAGIGYLVPCSGPNLALFKYLLLVVCKSSGGLLNENINYLPHVLMERFNLDLQKNLTNATAAMGKGKSCSGTGLCGIPAKEWSRPEAPKPPPRCGLARRLT